MNLFWADYDLRRTLLNAYRLMLGNLQLSIKIMIADLNNYVIMRIHDVET